MRRSVASHLGINDDGLLAAYVAEEAHGDVADALRAVECRYRLTAESLVGAWQARLRAHVSRAHDHFQISYDPRPDEVQRVVGPHMAYEALMLLPDEEFLTAIEHASRKHAARSRSGRGRRAVVPAPTLLDHADRVFETHGLPWRAGGDRVEWVGEPVAHAVTVRPALSALADARLGDARAAFEEALSRRRRGDVKSLEAAIVEAAKAVESALKALLSAGGVSLPRNEAIGSLWGAVVQGRLIDGLWEPTVLAVAGPRNRLAAHGATPGAAPVRASDAQAAVAAAATALQVIADRLP